MKNRIFVIAAMAACLLLAAPAVGGCGLLDKAETLDALKAQAAALEKEAALTRQVADELEAQARAFDAVIAAMPDGPDKDKLAALRDRTVTDLASVQAFLDKGSAVLAEINAKVQQATDALDAIHAAAAAGATFLPPPWNMVGTLGIGLVIGLIRAWKVKSNAKTGLATVDGIVKKALAADTTGELREMLDTVQTSGVKKLVDQAQGKIGLPF